MNRKKIKTILALIVFLVSFNKSYSQVSIYDGAGSSPEAHPAAVLDLKSEDKGLLIPRMDTDSRDNINNPAESLIIFNEEKNCVEVHLNGEWNELWCKPEPEIDACEGVSQPTLDGYNYEIIGLGDQCWFAENLRYLPDVHQVDDASDSEPRYYVHGYNGTVVADAILHEEELHGSDINVYETFGVLYNWTAAINSCPDGWSLPDDDDWKELELYLGMEQSEVDAYDLDRGTNEGAKIAGNEALWQSGELTDDPEFGLTGFDALPAGHRRTHEDFTHLGDITNFWVATEECDHWDDETYCYRGLSSSIFIGIDRMGHYGEAGYSVRCIKD